MKNRLTYVFLIGVVSSLIGCQAKTNTNYLGNKPPLLRAKYLQLPLGSVRPEGWLKDELVIQSKGLTGYVDEFFLTDSRWKGGNDNNKVPGTRDSWAVNYLRGLVGVSYILDDARLKRKAQDYIEWIISSARPDGWFGPPWEQGYEESTVCDPGHQKHALMALFDYYDATGDERVVPLAKNFMAFMMKNIREFPKNKWWGMGAMTASVPALWLYNRTGDAAYLDYVKLVWENSFDFESFFMNFPWTLEALANHKIPYNWSARGKTAHGPLLFGALSHPANYYMLSHDERAKDSVYAGIAALEKNHGQAGGRFSGDEHISGTRPTQGTELCGIISTMASMENLFGLFGDPAFGDRLELLAFNSLPGTITPDFWAHQYVQQANQVLVSNAEREWSTNPGCANIYGLSPHYPCCTFSMHRGFPEFIKNMWMATEDNGLIAAAYGPSRVTARVADGVDATIVETTEYPWDGAIRLALELPRPCEFPLHLRIPGWAAGATIRAGGKTLRPKAGTVARIKRTWRTGDAVEIEFPMTVRTETRYNQSISVLRGPVYYSLRIGREFKAVVTTDYYCFPNTIPFKGNKDWEIHPTTPWNYGLVIDRVRPESGVSVTRNKIGRFPFADRGDIAYLEDKAAFAVIEDEAPVVLRVRGKIVPEWQLKKHSADDPPPSPVVSKEPEEELILVPYGCARLRITEFPIVGKN